MRILLDECVHAGLKRAFPDDTVKTVSEVDWGGIKNGKLLALISGQFDVFLTIDQNIRHQQNLSGLPFAILFVAVPNNIMESYLPMFGLIKTTAHQLQPGDVKLIP